MSISRGFGDRDMIIPVRLGHAVEIAVRGGISEVLAMQPNGVEIGRRASQRRPARCDANCDFQGIENFRHFVEISGNTCSAIWYDFNQSFMRKAQKPLSHRGAGQLELPHQSELVDVRTGRQIKPQDLLPELRIDGVTARSLGPTPTATLVGGSRRLARAFGFLAHELPAVAVVMRRGGTAGNIVGLPGTIQTTTGAYLLLRQSNRIDNRNGSERAATDSARRPQSA